MKVIATKPGKFAPRDGGEPFNLNPGDEVPAYLAELAIKQGWGKAEPLKKAAKTSTALAQDD